MDTLTHDNISHDFSYLQIRSCHLISEWSEINAAAANWGSESRYYEIMWKRAVNVKIAPGAVICRNEEIRCGYSLYVAAFVDHTELRCNWQSPTHYSPSVLSYLLQTYMQIMYVGLYARRLFLCTTWSPSIPIKSTERLSINLTVCPFLPDDSDFRYNCAWLLN